MRRVRGFTLVEVLVAIAILALLAVMGWRGLDGIIRARTVLGAQTEATRGMQLAFAQLQSDCEHLAGTQLLKQRSAFDAGNDRLALVRTVLSDNAALQLQVVTYRVRNGVLTRRESLPTRDLSQLDQLWIQAASDADPSPGVALQSGVLGMTSQVFENGAWRPSATPPQTASAGQPLIKPEPKGLEVALQIQGLSGGLVKVFLLGGA